VIEYKKGKENKVVNALSRKDSLISTISFATPAWVTNIEASYSDDPHYTEIIQQLMANALAVPHYSIHSGILRYKGKICIGNSAELNKKIISSLHSSTIGGYSGIKTTYQRVKRVFYWPQLRRDAEQCNASCPVCQRAKSEHCHYTGLLTPLPIPNLAWTFISMYFIDGMQEPGTKNVILVVVDRLTKYAQTIPDTEEADRDQEKDRKHIEGQDLTMKSRWTAHRAQYCFRQVDD
jgi:hypothetical protein